MILMPAMNSALYCGTYILPYVYIYIYTHHWYFLFFFTLAYVSRKVYIWYWTDMSAISSCKFCIFWKVCCILSCCSWVLFTKEHVQIEHALQQALPCWITVTHLQGNNTFCAWKRNWNFRHALPEKTAVSWTVFFFEKIIRLENNPAFCSELCTVPLWKCKHTSTCLKDLLHALHNYCPFQSR